MTLRPLSRPGRPLHSWSTTFCLRAIVTDQSSPGWSTLHAELLGAARRAVRRGRLEQFLGRDAPDVEARAADLAAFSTMRDVEAGRRAVERRCVAARTAADDHDVVVLSHAATLTGGATEPLDGPRQSVGERHPRFPSEIVRGGVHLGERVTDVSRSRIGVLGRGLDIEQTTEDLEQIEQ